MIPFDRLRIVRADEPRIREIFQWMERQFAPGEIKPLDSILRMVQEGYYRVYALLEEDTLLAYALLVQARGSCFSLLDYFAVLPALQDMGVGGFFLHALQKICVEEVLLIEAEDPETDAQSRSHRQRRLRFYLRSGCVLTNVKTTVFGFDYVILVLPALPAQHPEDVAAALEDIYHRMLPADVYARNILFRER